MKLNRNKLRKIIIQEVKRSLQEMSADSYDSNKISTGLSQAFRNLGEQATVDSTTVEGDALYVNITGMPADAHGFCDRVNIYLHKNSIKGSGYVEGCSAYIKPFNANSVRVFYWDCPDGHVWAGESWVDASSDDDDTKGLRDPSTSR